MKMKAYGLVLFCLLLTPILAACGPEETEPATTTENTDYEGLGLTEVEIKMLEERGVANVDSAEVASKIAGFEVAVPAYMPDGFSPGKYSITLSGAGMPTGMTPKFNNTKVQRTYTWQEDANIMILLIQSPLPFSVGGGELAEICGQQGERAFSKTDPNNGQPYDKITFSWGKGGIYYAITGTLTGTLDEAEIQKMAGSIGAGSL
jgi:hypothetical protein